jgi:hypothetical protein
VASHHYLYFTHFVQWTLKITALCIFAYPCNLDIQHLRDTSSEVPELEVNLGTAISGIPSSNGSLSRGDYSFPWNCITLRVDGLSQSFRIKRETLRAFVCAVQTDKRDVIILQISCLICVQKFFRNGMYFQKLQIVRHMPVVRDFYH